MTRKRWPLFLTLLTLLTVSMGPRTTALAADSRTFPETGKTVTGKFLTYWNDHGGLAQQGYPISDVLSEVSDTDGKTYTVQYFERAIFELHPENAAPNDVLLTLLGSLLYNQKYPNGASGQTANTTNPRLFSETGKTVGGVFRTYWEEHGALAQQGYPISDEFQEQSDTDGNTYTVQYFERAVFEYHPENAGKPSEVLLSLLGTFRDKVKHGGTSAPTATPTTPPTPDTTSLTQAGWTNAVATTSNMVFFYNKDNGHGATAKIGDDGSLTPLQAFPSEASHNTALNAGYTNVVACPNNNVLLYSATTGDYHIMTLAENGTYLVNIAFTIASGWSVINADIETGLLMYFNPSTATLAIDHIDANGQETAVAGGATGKITSADIIVPVGAQTSNWLVYSKTTKTATLVHLGADGTVTSAGSFWNFGPAWNYIVSDNGGHMVWYDRTNQAAMVTGYDAAGDIAILHTYPGVSSQWTGLVGALNHVIIYYDQDGNIATDLVQSDGTEVASKRYTAGH